MFWVYILKSDFDNSYYVGYTGNLPLRLFKHNTGQSEATKRKRPWRIVYFEEYENKIIALQREKQIKRYKGGQAFKQLAENSK